MSRIILDVIIPMHTVSEANTRGHYMARARRAKEQRAIVGLRLASWRKALRAAPGLVVHLTRHGVRMLDDDNLAGALKAVRDGVADVIGRDDADPSITWRYGQEPVPKLATGVRITVSVREDA